MNHLTIICCVIAAAYGQSLSVGKCPEPSALHSFDVDQFVGKWFEVGKSFSIWEITGKCSTSEWTKLSDNQMKVSHHDISKLTNLESVMTGKVTINGTKLITQYHMPVVGDLTRNVWFVKSDYITHAVLWACTNYGFMHTAYGWIYAREAYITNNFTVQAQTAFENAGVPALSMRKVDHSNCP